jgi:mRNA interferase MazF
VSFDAADALALARFWAAVFGSDVDDDSTTDKAFVEAAGWADPGEARGSRPARGRPVLVVQSDPFSASRLNTIIAAVITSNTVLAAMPGNVFVPAAVSGLPKDSVVNVTALATLNKTDLESPAGQLPESLMNDVSRGLRRVLGL